MPPEKYAMVSGNVTCTDYLNTSWTNESSTVTCLFDGPIVDRIRDEQFTILLPSFVFTTILITVGMPGNLIVIVVYFSKMAKTTSRRFFIALAVCDLVNCAFMAIELSLLANFYNFDYPILCKVSRFSNYFLNNYSSCLLTFIAIDRYQRVCHPLRPNMTQCHFKAICSTAGLFSFVSASPALYIYGTRSSSFQVPGVNNTYMFTKTCHVDNETDKTFRLVFSLYLLGATIVMFIALLTMYIVIARVLYRRRNKMDHCYKLATKSTMRSTTKAPRKTSFDHSPRLVHFKEKQPPAQLMVSQRDRTHSDTSGIIINGIKIRVGRTTFILFIVTIIFVLSFVPHLVVVNMRYITPKKVASLSKIGKQVYNFVLRSYLINSAVNPLIYCFMNSDFRKTVKTFFKELLCGCCD